MSHSDVEALEVKPRYLHSLRQLTVTLLSVLTTWVEKWRWVVFDVEVTIVEMSGLFMADLMTLPVVHPL